MLQPRRLYPILLVLVLFALGCSGSSDPGDSLPDTDDEQSEAADESPDETTTVPLAEPADLPDGAAVAVGDNVLSQTDLDEFLAEWATLNTGDPTVTPDVTVGGVNFWVQITALGDELDGELTDDDFAAGDAWIADLVPTLETDTRFHDAVTLWWATRLVVAREQGVDTEVTDQQIQDRLDLITADAAPNVCSSHLLVATEAEADAARERIEAGEEFAIVAAEVSTDTGSGANGGSLGCVPQGSFVAPFEEAVWTGQEGDLLGPVESEFGFHVILHEGFEQETFEFDDVQDELRQLILDERFEGVDAQHEARAIEAAQQAPIAVAESVGAWDQAEANLTPA